MIVIESIEFLNCFDIMVHVLLLASLALGSSVLAAPNYAVPDAQPKNAVAINSAPVRAS